MKVCTRKTCRIQFAFFSFLPFLTCVCTMILMSHILFCHIPRSKFSLAGVPAEKTLRLELVETQRLAGLLWRLHLMRSTLFRYLHPAPSAPPFYLRLANTTSSCTADFPFLHATSQYTGHSKISAPSLPPFRAKCPWWCRACAATRGGPRQRKGSKIRCCSRLGR